MNRATKAAGILLAGTLLLATSGLTARERGEILVGAGDIASCESQGDEATAKLLDRIPGTVFTAGDNSYESGTKSEFASCYSTSWGRHKYRTMPAPGNHDYGRGGYEDGDGDPHESFDPSGYFDYFGHRAGDPDKGYYSYSLGDWQVFALNSNCARIGGCGEGSEQLGWLEEELQKNAGRCQFAYWHHPLYSTGPHGGREELRPLYEALYDAGVEVVVNGHDHTYERFVPQDPEGNPDPEGIRQFVVGTGGKSLHFFEETNPNSEVRSSEAFGVIKFTLKSASYEWEFVPIEGMAFRDSGSGECH